MSTKAHLHNKSREVCIKARSPTASLPSKGQVTEQRTVKWSIHCLGCQRVLFWCTKNYVLVSLWYTVYFLTSWHHFTISSFEHGWNRSIQRKIWWNPVTWILQTGKYIQLLDIAIKADHSGIIEWVFFVPFSSNAEVSCQLSGVQGCAQSL